MEQTLFDLLGEDGISAIVRRFYAAVPSDEILGPMYPAEDLAGAEMRLRLFLIYRLGGPDTYLKERGHPALRQRHFPFAITEVARNRWVQLMDRAIDGSDLSVKPREALREFLHKTASFLINSQD